MKKKIAIKEKDFLFDVSGVHSHIARERIEWVFNNVDKPWLKSYKVASSPSDVLIVPPFAVVVSTPEMEVLDFDTNRRHIYAIELYDCIDDVKTAIEYHLIGSPVGYNVEVELFVHNGKCFEKAAYNVGTYEKATGAVCYRCKLDELYAHFDIESAVVKTEYEPCLINAKLEEYHEEKIYIEIPGLWEINYINQRSGKGKSRYYSYKKLKSIINEAVYMMIGEELDTITIDNSWYTLTLSIDENADVFSMDDGDIFDEVEHLKQSLLVEVQLSY